MDVDKPGIVPVTPSEVLYCSPDVAVVQLHDGKSIPIGGEQHNNAELIGQVLVECLADGHLLDTTIKDDFRAYRIHLVVLTAHSPKYRETFLARGQGEDIEVKGLQNVHCLGHVLEFLYTGRLVLTKTTVEDALTIAEQLDLPPVSDQCRQFLRCYDTESALDFLRLAQRHKFEDLAQEIGRYIRQYSDLSLASKAFLDLGGPEPWIAILGPEGPESGTEGIIFRKFLQWAVHRKAERKEAAQEVLVKMCWKSIPVLDLESALDNHGDLFDSDQLRDVLYEAFKYHALKAVEDGYEPKVADWKNAPFFGNSQ